MLGNFVSYKVCRNKRGFQSLATQLAIARHMTLRFYWHSVYLFRRNLYCFCNGGHCVSGYRCAASTVSLVEVTSLETDTSALLSTRMEQKNLKVIAP